MKFELIKLYKENTDFTKNEWETLKSANKLQCEEPRIGKKMSRYFLYAGQLDEIKAFLDEHAAKKVYGDPKSPKEIAKQFLRNALGIKRGYHNTKTRDGAVHVCLDKWCAEVVRNVCRRLDFNVSEFAMVAIVSELLGLHSQLNRSLLTNDDIRAIKTVLHVNFKEFVETFNEKYSEVDFTKNEEDAE